MVWNLWIVNHAITHGQNPYFTSLVYHPLGARLVKHTLVLGYWPVTFLAQVFSGGDPLYPLYAYRLSILLSFTLALALTYAVLRRLGFAPLVACVPALGYAFCDFNILHVPHLNHVSAAFFLPLAALMLIRLVQHPGTARAAAAGFILALGVLLHGARGLPLDRRARRRRGGRGPAIDARRRPACVATLGGRGLAAGVLAFGLTVAPFAANWMLDSGKAPNPRQASNWSANLAAFVVPRPDATPLYGDAFAGVNAAISKGIGGHEVFLGFPMLLLAGLGIARRPRGWTAVAAVIAALFLLLSLGRC
jgi:hypothetical protein